MCRLSIHYGLQTSLFIWYNKDIQERYGSILSWLFTSESYVFIYAVKMLKETCFLGWLDDSKGAIHKSSPEVGGAVVLNLWLWSQILPYISLQQWDLLEIPWQLLLLVQNTWLGRWNKYWSGKTPNRLVMFFTDRDVLLYSSGSSSNNFLMVLMAGWIGTEVKSAFTSKDIIHWSSCSLMSFICWIKSCLLWTWYMDFPTRGFGILASSLDVS